MSAPDAHSAPSAPRPLPAHPPLAPATAALAADGRATGPPRTAARRPERYKSRREPETPTPPMDGACIRGRPPREEMRAVIDTHEAAHTNTHARTHTSTLARAETRAHTAHKRLSPSSHPSSFSFSFRQMPASWPPRNMTQPPEKPRTRGNERRRLLRAGGGLVLVYRHVLALAPNSRLRGGPRADTK